MRSQAETLIHGALLATLVSVAAGAAAAPADRNYEATGQASWYGDELRGRKTASGEVFDPARFTAAHRTLPLRSYAEVTALDSGRSIVVRINDRGPYHGNRLIDLSHGAARQLGIMGHGARLVRIRRIEPADAERLARDLERLRQRSDWSAPMPTRATLPLGGGPYFIRVATFSSKSRADSMAGRLGGQLVTTDGLYQVRLGPYAAQNKLEAALARLAAKGYPDVRIVR